MTRTNEQWLCALRDTGGQQAQAIEDLRTLLLRGALFTFNRHLGDLRDRSAIEVERLAEDCAQEALVAVLAQLDHFRGDSKFTTWAYKFAINIALTTARRERWRGVSLDELADEDVSGEWARLLVDDHVSPSRSVMQDEAMTAIQEIIATELSPKQRQILRWMVFDEVPMDVVVERMGSNRNAIYKMLHDARQKMKRRLEAKGFGVVEVIELFGAQG